MIWRLHLICQTTLLLVSWVPLVHSLDRSDGETYKHAPFSLYYEECLVMGETAIAGCPETKDIFQVRGGPASQGPDNLETSNKIQQLLNRVPYTDARTGVLYKNKTVYECHLEGEDAGLPWEVFVHANSTSLSSANILTEMTANIDIECAEFMPPQEDIPKLDLKCRPTASLPDRCDDFKFSMNPMSLLVSMSHQQLVIDVSKGTEGWRKYTCDVTQSRLTDSQSDIRDVMCRNGDPEEGSLIGEPEPVLKAMHGFHLAIGMTFAHFDFARQAQLQLAHLWGCYLESLGIRGLVPREPLANDRPVISKTHRGNTVYGTISRIEMTPDNDILEIMHVLNSPVSISVLAEFHYDFLSFLVSVEQTYLESLDTQAESYLDFQTSEDIHSVICFWLYDMETPMPDEATFCVPKIAYTPLSFSKLTTVDRVSTAVGVHAGKACIHDITTDYRVWFDTSQGHVSRGQGQGQGHFYNVFTLLTLCVVTGAFW